jgi:hypothetical protein
MGWAIGYDSNWERDIGYGVPAYCDHPGCNREIDRGLAHVCGKESYGGDRGCGLYFCDNHQCGPLQLCPRCYPRRRKPFRPKPDHPDWIKHKMTDPSWARWREAQKIKEVKCSHRKRKTTKTNIEEGL